MNEVIIKENDIKNLIYEVCGYQVMLDSDLAKLYEVETKRINEAVSRNREKFPDRFSFKIDESEYNSLKSQFATSKGGSRKGHTVFTEQGVMMLATILKSSIATEVTIRIMDAFVLMNKYISTNLIEQKYINNMVLHHDDKIKMLENSFNSFTEKKKVNEIYFNGQIYDAYSKIKDIFNLAKKELIIVDTYADYTLLDIIKKLNANVIIITKQNSLLTNQDIDNYNQQYYNLKVIS